MLEWSTSITWDNRGVVNKAQETATVTSEEDLLFGTFNSCREFRSIRFLYLLAGLVQVSFRGYQGCRERDRTHDVCQLSLSNQVLGLRSDELLL